MARPKVREDEQAKDLVKDMVVKTTHEMDITDMPFETMGDYMRYNERATSLNKKLRLARYPIKPCPIELHPHDRVTISRNDNNTGKIPALLSNDRIHFDKKLEPGKMYELPRCVIDHLAEKGTPVWKWFDKGEGEKETRISHYEPRFSIRTHYRD